MDFSYAACVAGPRFHLDFPGQVLANTMPRGMSMTWFKQEIRHATVRFPLRWSGWGKAAQMMQYQYHGVKKGHSAI
jgi:hypothetical protein